MKMTDNSDLKILIADDEPLAAERLQMLLARIKDVHLVGTAHDGDRKSTRLNSSHIQKSRMPSSA